MLKADPKPNTPAASPPDIDEYLGVFYRGKLIHGQDGEMKQVQTALLNATGPLCGLWSQIHEQGLDKDEGLIQVPVVLETIQCTLVLLGNANHLLSEKRRLSMLKSIDPQLTKYAKGDFSDAGKHLFGNKFAKELVTHVEADTAICKASAIASKATRSPSRGKSPASSRTECFRWGQTGGHGTSSGKTIFNPYIRPISYQGRGRGRYIHQSPTSVFNRLGPNPSPANPPRPKGNSLCPTYMQV